MFVKKLAEKAFKKPAAPSGGLRPEDVDPRLVFHYGAPAGANALAYDPLQKIIAIATGDGRIKLFGTDNTQALLESEDTTPSKFLQFLDNKGILFRVTIQNHIEVWNISNQQLIHVYIVQEEITSFTVIQRSLYTYIGKCSGNVSVLKLDMETCHLVHMKYNIPYAVSHGEQTEVASDTAVMYILPQPMAESKRVLIIFRDGLINLWGIQESRTLFTTGGNMLLVMRNEAKKVVSACWTCPSGSKVAVGYSNGDIFIWGVPKASDKIASSTDNKELFALKNVPLLKLNIGYKMDKVPIVSLRWVFADGRASRLYVNGVSELGSSNMFQVIILNENTESRTIKLVLPLPEACIDMEIVSKIAEHSKHKENALLLLLRSGCLCVYDDSEIEHYLLQCHSKFPPPVPRQITVKLPFGDSNISVAQYITDIPNLSSYVDEDYKLSTKIFSSFLPPDLKETDRNCLSSARFCGLFTKTNSLYITGHYDGAINFWDASCPLLFQICSIKQKNEVDHPLIDIPVTALYFDISSNILVSGHQNGVVYIFQFKGTQSTADNIFSLLQAKRGCNYIVSSVKLYGAIVAISMQPSSGHIAIGTDKGYVSIVEMEGMSVLYEKRFPCEPCSGIISLQFELSLNKSEENFLLAALDDSSVFAFEVVKGNVLDASVVHPKRPGRALFMQILNDLDMSPRGSQKYDSLSESKGNSMKSNALNQSLLLLCSERSIRMYSLVHVIQGIKKVYHKKRLHGTCCWASTFHSPDIGLILIFTCGKIEIRCLPDLTLLKETSVRGFAFPAINSGSGFSGSLCASRDGEVIAVMGDQEIFFLSLWFKKDHYRLLEPVGQVYMKDMVASLEGPSSMMHTHKEKKSGIFNAVIREIKGKKHGEEMECVDSDASIGEELSVIFSTVNFSLNVESPKNQSMGEDDVELSIDDINLEDPSEKTKGRDIAMLDKQKLGKKLQSLKGVLKSITTKKAEIPLNEEHGDGKATDAIDQIKKKYGYPLSGPGELNVPKLAQSKLSENLGKLQGINMRTAEMHDTARSFSSMAKDLLSTAEQVKRIP